ncbi:hypothetical protein KIW84_051890 [Lathyrus oleraceus]|uniref:DUF3475 domain-containing protein n=1 Tax=Pisum sativum TaxID=3888 RepID=A0A9D5AEC2_PEA|nr:hypothetical protein KIW84_051890 [Pisum sativum]
MVVADSWFQSLWKTNSEKAVANLRDEVSNSVHIKKLVSDDGNFIVRLIMAYVDESVTRPAKKCSDARFEDFEKAFDRFITRGFCLLRKWIKKLAFYVSDDGCSRLTFYALQEATRFAASWVPVCKKPCTTDYKDLPEFKQDWLKMKEEYEQLGSRIENATQKSVPCQLMGEFEVFPQAQSSFPFGLIAEKCVWDAWIRVSA